MRAKPEAQVGVTWSGSVEESRRARHGEADLPRVRAVAGGREVYGAVRRLEGELLQPVYLVDVPYPCRCGCGGLAEAAVVVPAGMAADGALVFWDGQAGEGAWGPA